MIMVIKEVNSISEVPFSIAPETTAKIGIDIICAIPIVYNNEEYFIPFRNRKELIKDSDFTNIMDTYKEYEEHCNNEMIKIKNYILRELPNLKPNEGDCITLYKIKK